MKKLVILLLAVFIGSLTYASAEPVEKLDKETVKVMTDDQRQDRVQVLEDRIAEISDMSLRNLDKDARKDLRGEIDYIKQELMMHQNNTGIYISGGALLVIILLLILL